MIECADPATCQQIAAAQRELVVDGVVASVVLAVGATAIRQWRNRERASR